MKKETEEGSSFARLEERTSYELEDESFWYIII